MKKRIVPAFLAVILLLSVIPCSARALASITNFGAAAEYSGQFSDVSSAAWYADYVETAYEYELMCGESATTFAPEGRLTIAEAIKIASCIHSVYYTGNASFESSTPWYQSYVDYALENGIISSGYKYYNTSVTRAEFAKILAEALPDEVLTAVNTVEDNAIPDVDLSYSYSAAVYKLYRAGVFIGGSGSHAFYPNTSITRAEAAAAAVRMANVDERRRLTLTTTLSAVDIYASCSPGVFYIETYDFEGNMLRTGSGFFISSSGTAVTNYHVIAGADTAVITTSDGTQYSVSGIYDMDRNNDIVLLEVDGNAFSYLKTGNSDELLTGETIYTISSPLGLSNSFSPGSIAKNSRTFDGVTYIQITAAISAGSSGGALLNTKGQVIGVTAATFTAGQNLNLAIPINVINGLSTESVSLLSAVFPYNYYAGFYPVPDFGKLTGVPVYDEIVSAGSFAVYYYEVSRLPDGSEAAIAAYADTLLQSGFEYVTEYDGSGGNVMYVYYNTTYDWYVYFGLSDDMDTPCIAVLIE